MPLCTTRAAWCCNLREPYRIGICKDIKACRESLPYLMVCYDLRHSLRNRVLFRRDEYGGPKLLVGFSTHNKKRERDGWLLAAGKPIYFAVNCQIT